MRKVKKMKRYLAGTMALCIAVSGLFVAAPAEDVKAAETSEVYSEKPQWEEVAALLDSHRGVYTEPSKIDPTTRHTPDGPLMGNGTVLGFLSGKQTGDRNNQSIYLTRLDNYEELTDGSRDSQYVGFGGLDIRRTDDTGIYGTFSMTQDMKLAEVSGSSESGYDTTTWISAKENLMVTEITNRTDAPMDLDVSAWTTLPPSNNGGHSSTESRIEKDKGIITATRHAVSATYGTKVHATLASRIIGKTPEMVNVDNHTSKFSLSVAAGETIQVVSAVEGGKDSASYYEDAISKVEQYDTVDKIAEAKARHQQWWKDYWLKSYIKLDEKSDSIEKLYFGHMYQIGCALQAVSEHRAEGVTTGLFPWSGSVAPNWTGDYTLNSDVQRPMGTAITANRLNHIDNYTKVIEAYWDNGVKKAQDPKYMNYIINGSSRTKFTEGVRGSLFPTHIGPWGIRTENYDGVNDYWCSPSNASMTLQPMITYYKSTLDEDYLNANLYPKLRDTADFWVDYAEKDGDQYNIYGATYEDTKAHKNATLDLAGATYILKNAIEISEKKGLDAEKRAEWNEVYTHLAPYPTKTIDGKAYYREDEERNNDTTHSCFNVYGFAFYDLVGPSSPQDEKDKILTWLEKKQEFGTSDKQTRAAMTSARVGYNPDVWINAMKKGYVDSEMGDWMGMRPNNTVGDIGGSLFSSAIMECLMQSHEGFINFFPTWYEAQSASFKNLRAYGAFTVSGEQNSFGQTIHASIYSEKGTDCSVLNPWQAEDLELKVLEDGKEIKTTKKANSLGDVYTFATKAGKQYELKYAGELPDVINVEETSIDVPLNESAKMNVVSNSDKKIIWESDNMAVSSIDKDNGTVTGKQKGTATITASLEGTKIKDTCIVHIVDEKRIPSSQMTAVADSEENSGADGPAGNAVDGNESTRWHSAYSHGPKPDISKDMNNSITIDLGGIYDVGKLEYVPRQEENAFNGRILGYELWYSANTEGEDFVKISGGSGTWENTMYKKEAVFESVEARRIRFQAKNTTAGNPQEANKFICAAEFYVYEKFLPAPEVPAEEVVISPEALSLYENESGTITAHVLPENATYQEVKWKSSDNTVAMVKDGVVTAVKAGTATITAVSLDKQASAACEIRVTVDPELVEQLQNLCKEYEQIIKGVYTTESWKIFQTALEKAKASLENPSKVQSEIDSLKSAYEQLKEIEGIEIDQQEVEIEVGDSEQLSVRQNVDGKIQWRSSNNEIVNVSKEGKVLALGTGTATVTATVKGTEYQSSCTIKAEGGGSGNLAVLASSVTADSQHENFVPSNVIDGRTGGKGNESAAYAWVSASKKIAEPRWVQLDFDNPISINKWKVTHVASNGDKRSIAKDFELQVSENGTDWTSVDTVTGNKELITEKMLGQKVTSKYFRLYITVADNYNGQWANNNARIDELELIAANAPEVRLTDVKETEDLNLYVGTSLEEMEGQLPTTAEVTLGEDFVTEYPVTWNTDEYKAEEGAYIMEGTLAVPAAVKNPDNKKASIRVNVEKHVIWSIEYLMDIETELNTPIEELSIPQTLVAVLDDDSTQEVSVIWNKEIYNSAAAGTYKLEGTIADHSTYKNPYNVKARLNIFVNEVPNITEIGLQEEKEISFGKTVDEAASSLPSEVLVRLNQVEVRYLPVTWACESYDGTSAGVYRFTGTIAEGRDYQNRNSLQAQVNVVVMGEGVPTSEERAELKQSIMDAESIVAEKYSKESFEKVKEALAAAKAAEENPDADAAEINTSTEALKESIRNLVCGHPETQNVILHESSCLQDGVQITKCNVCREILKQETIPAAGHDFGEWKTVKNATIYEDGNEMRSCKVCDKTEERVIAKLPSSKVIFLNYDNRVLGQMQTIEMNGTAKAPQVPERKGYRFTGWDKTLTNITGDMVISAKYDLLTYKINYAGMSGVKNENPTVYTTVQTVVLGTPVKAGMVFQGWYMNGVRVTEISAGRTGDLTLTARWSKAPAKKGDTLSSGRLKYTITSTNSGKRTVKVTAPVKKTYSSITIPSTVKFKGNTYKVTEIGSKAFRKNTGLKSIKVGKYVNTIGSYAFDGAKKLKIIHLDSTSLKAVGKNAFKGINSKAVMKVPSKKFRDYQKLLAKKGQKSSVKIKK